MANMQQQNKQHATEIKRGGELLILTIVLCPKINFQHKYKTAIDLISFMPFILSSSFPASISYCPAEGRRQNVAFKALSFLADSTLKITFLHLAACASK